MTTQAASRTADDIIPFIKKYGVGSMAYSALQEGMQWFVMPGVGFIQYEPTDTILHRAVVLGDPICAAADREQLLSAFLKEFDCPVFIHISHDTGKVLEKLGFYINHMGMETVVDVQSFTLTGSKKEFLRSQKNRASKDGVTVGELMPQSLRESMPPTADATLARLSAEGLKKLSEEWMHRKAVHDHELAFLVRPAVFKDEFDVRKFVAIKDKKVVGFVFFDPMYRDGKVYGYIANILRSFSDQSYSVTDFIITEAIAKFKEEGVEALSLGLCPFYKVDDSEDFNFSKPLAAIYKYAYEHANYMYSFKSLAFHKDRYRPDQPGARYERAYSAAKLALPLITVYGVFTKMGIHPTRQTAEHAIHVAEEIARNIPEEFKKILQHWKHDKKVSDSSST